MHSRHAHRHAGYLSMHSEGHSYTCWCASDDDSETLVEDATGTYCTYAHEYASTAKDWSTMQQCCTRMERSRHNSTQGSWHTRGHLISPLSLCASGSHQLSRSSSAQQWWSHGVCSRTAATVSVHCHQLPVIHWTCTPVMWPANTPTFPNIINLTNSKRWAAVSVY